MPSSYTKLVKNLMERTRNFYLPWILNGLILMVFGNVLYHLGTYGVVARGNAVKNSLAETKILQHHKDKSYTQRQFGIDEVMVSFHEEDNNTSVEQEDEEFTTDHNEREEKYGLSLHGYANASTTKPKNNRKYEEKPKVILVWSDFDSWKKKDHDLLFSRLLNGKCPNSCRVHYNKKLAPLADAIVFTYGARVATYPTNHSQNQMWVFASIEAPTNFQWQSRPVINNVFDWTMTYHRSSDVVTPYGRVIRRVSNDSRSSNETERDYWSEKDSDKFAVWMVSNCVTSSKREGYVRELKKYVKIDTYGKCGTKKCGSRLVLPNVKDRKYDRHCRKVKNSYMFYLAFENSLCEDYITEKFYMALQSDAIPVVFGGGDYNGVAPPNSFINSLEFGTPESLALYLREVASNQTLYNSYFKWKRHYTVELGFPFSPLVCDLCSKLLQKETTFSNDKNHARRNELGRYVNVAEWFQKVSKCRTWDSKNNRTRVLHKL